MAIEPAGKCVLKNRAQSRILNGHPWIYKSDIAKIDSGVKPGDLVRLTSDRGRPLGVGYFNPASEISVRLLSWSNTPIAEAFFEDKIRRAAELRKTWFIESNALRLFSGEADGLPGLIIDQYEKVLVVQFLTLGIERFRTPILSAIRKIVAPQGIYERSDTPSRRLEGLEDTKGWLLKPNFDRVRIHERDVAYDVIFGEGHKTGFYLDQRENRLLLRDFIKPCRVLDAFCYEGGFGLQLAKAGSTVLGIDSQANVIARAKEHAALNALPPDRIQFEVANVFDELRRQEKAGNRFDLVILDPPSFGRRSSNREGAAAGYKEIILRSMKILEPHGGHLAVFSCSYHVDDSELLTLSMQAAVDSHKDFHILRFFKQSIDHPICPFIPETYYLKGFLFQVFQKTI